MKIDLSKYPPGTKFKTKAGYELILIGKSRVLEEGTYVFETINGFTVYRKQNGEPLIKFSDDDVITSENQPSKYLVSFCKKDGTVGTTVVTNPTELTPEHFLLMCLRNESVSGMFDIDESIPDKVLSWSKIEE